jgi:hypothetical protein
MRFRHRRLVYKEFYRTTVKNQIAKDLISLISRNCTGKFLRTVSESICPSVILGPSAVC